MKLRSIVAASAVALVLATGCGRQDGPAGADGTWVGTIVTEGDVTTVVNESGSVWGGAATLVEELAIGVESGAEEYMFGRIEGIGATEDRIYVLDDQLPAVRVYDHAGTHLFDFGGAGGGPGEFDNPVVMAVDPGGRVLVQDLRRINVFDLDGSPIDTWAHRGGLVRPPVVTANGTAFFPKTWREGDARRTGLVGIGPDGSESRRIPTPDYEGAKWRLQSFRPDGTLIRELPVPYAPRMEWSVLPSGAVVEGLSDQYRFTVTRADGDRLVVEKPGARAPVSPEEAEWLATNVAARMKASLPSFVWTANPIPNQKPAFLGLYGDRYGRIWVHRIEDTETVPGCDHDIDSVEPGGTARPCWLNVTGFDVFDAATGRFLGGVGPEVPVFRRSPVFLRGAVLFVVEDEAGTIMVKRYRLVLPGEGGH